jgi:hypothetical protein
MSAPGTTAPAGWYPDPHDVGRGRYWNGFAWTDLSHTPGQAFPAGAEPKAPPGTDSNTPWIWLIVLMPIVPTVLLLFVPWHLAFAIDPSDPDPRSGMVATLALYLSPFLWISTALSYLVYGLSVFFAYLDAKALTARRVPRPFHWAFAFLGSAVYAIGRSIVAGRRTGKGYAPIWVEAGVVVLSFAVAGVILAVMFSGMADLFETLRDYR